MTHSSSHAGETHAGAKKSFTRFVPAIVRILLGLMFLMFGLNGFLNFMPAPKDMPQDIMTAVGGLMKGGYMTVVSGTEVIVAVLLLINRFVPLALALLAPIVVGIITFHIALAPATIGPGIVVLVMELYLAWVYRGAFKPMLTARTTPGA
ncbi:MAG: DoxX family membrane protein [Opitutaceae bacterium]|nr:DoxX family membrane protein [Verrucomicrobiales bacterium]